jgi:hypothetical protein
MTEHLIHHTILFLYRRTIAVGTKSDFGIPDSNYPYQGATIQVMSNPFLVYAGRKKLENSTTKTLRWFPVMASQVGLQKRTTADISQVSNGA